MVNITRSTSVSASWFPVELFGWYGPTARSDPCAVAAGAGRKVGGVAVFRLDRAYQHGRH